MDNLKLAAVLRNTPENGGLNYADYPNPYGLRSYTQQAPYQSNNYWLNNMEYGGQMMPKGQGWLGQLQNKSNDIMTEYSTGDNKGDFPSLVPTLNKSEISQLLNTGEITKNIYQKASDWANNRRNNGLNPFYDLN